MFENQNLGGQYRSQSSKTSQRQKNPDSFKNQNKIQMLIKKAEQECFEENMKQVKNLSNVNNFEDLAKVYKNRQSKLDRISALDGSDMPPKPNQTQPRRSKQRKTLGQHEVYSESTLPYTNNNFSDLAKTEGAHHEMKNNSHRKQQEMIKKYQMKNDS